MVIRKRRQLTERPPPRIGLGHRDRFIPRAIVRPSPAIGFHPTRTRTAETTHPHRDPATTTGNRSLATHLSRGTTTAAATMVPAGAFPLDTISAGTVALGIVARGIVAAAAGPFPTQRLQAPVIRSRQRLELVHTIVFPTPVTM
jgi:hypothetical protein